MPPFWPEIWWCSLKWSKIYKNLNYFKMLYFWTGATNFCRLMRNPHPKLCCLTPKCIFLTHVAHSRGNKQALQQCEIYCQEALLQQTNNPPNTNIRRFCNKFSYKCNYIISLHDWCLCFAPVNKSKLYVRKESNNKLIRTHVVWAKWN